MNVPLIIAIAGFAVIAVLIFTVIDFNIDKNDLANSKKIGLVGDISIGTLLPLTGDLSSQGEGDKTAINLAAEDFNEYLDKNNANWRLKIVHEDSETNPVIALEKVTAFHAKNINLVVGPASSGELQNIMEYANSNGILLFSQSSTAPSLAIPGDTVFRLTPDDAKQGPVITAILDDNDIDIIIQLVRADAWGDGLSKTIEESFMDEPEHVSQIISYTPDDPEFSVTTSLLAKKVNDQVIIHGTEKVGVVIIGFAEVLQFMQSATEHEILDDVRWFGTDGTTNDNKITNDPLVSEFAEKTQFTTTLLAVSENDIRKDVEQRIVSQIGKTPKSYAFSAYDIVWILGLAMQEVDSNDVGDLTLIIPEIASNYNGAMGNTRLNAAGDLDASSYDIWEIRDSSWNIIGHYHPNIDSILKMSTLVEYNIKNAVSQTIAQYDGNLDSIINLQFGEYYSFVLDGNLDTILVHPNSDAIGVYPTGINNANIPSEKILELLKTEDGVWVDYQYDNPATNHLENKRSWLVLYDGYVFASGYYNPHDMQE